MAYRTFTIYNEYCRGRGQPTPPLVVNVNLDHVVSWFDLKPDDTVTPPIPVIEIRLSSGSAYAVIGPF